MHIPRVFHRIWLGDRPMPPEFVEFGRSWERLHPGWKMMLWTDSNLPPLVNRWAYERSLSFAGKSNIARYEILREFGGIYVDTDFECLRNLEPLIADVECFVAQESVMRLDVGKLALLNNAIVGTTPGHPLFNDLVASLEANVRTLPSEARSIFQSGPYYLTSVIQAHPKVTIFPAALFYPYGPLEPWRRHEQFPQAYAVHHWTHTDLTVRRAPQRRIRDDARPSLTIFLQATDQVDAEQLRWALAGLGEQTATDFEILVPQSLERSWIEQVCGEFSSTLNIRAVRYADAATSDGAASRRLMFSEAQAERTLLLNADCVADPDLVEAHAKHAARNVLVYSYRRLYPAEKFFPFSGVVNYSVLKANSVSERTDEKITPSIAQWERVTDGCLSVPTKIAREVLQIGEEESRDLARKLSSVDCPSVPCFLGGRVTRMAAPSRSMEQNRSTRGVAP